MIFEVNYNELQVPLSLIKSLLTDKEYKGDVKQVIFEVTKEKVMLFFDDDRLAIRMKVELEGAEVILPGAATCSFSSFFEMVKVFKKSEEPILVEREDDFIRVDDGVYPEEMFKLKTDGLLKHLPSSELTEPFLGISSVSLREGIQLATTIIRKTDIPVDMIDTQGVYIGAEGSSATFNSFSLHNFHRSKRKAVVHREQMIKLSKPIASALSKVADTTKKSITEWALSTVSGDEVSEQGILIESDIGNISLFFTLAPLTDWEALSNNFKSVELNFKASKEKAKLESILEMNALGKIKLADNIVVEDGLCVLQPSGYPAPLVKKMWEKGAWKENGLFFYADGGVGAKPVLCLFDSENEEEKMTTVSYREGIIA